MMMMIAMPLFCTIHTEVRFLIDVFSGSEPGQVVHTRATVSRQYNLGPAEAEKLIQ